jgi:hypothetical protein
MSDSNAIWHFVVSALTVWGLTDLLSAEVGRRGPSVRLGMKADNGFIGGLTGRFYCLSLWFSLPLAIWLSSGWIGLILNWQALSGAACLLKRFSPNRTRSSLGWSPLRGKQYVLRSKAK